MQNWDDSTSSCSCKARLILQKMQEILKYCPTLQYGDTKPVLWWLNIFTATILFLWSIHHSSYHYLSFVGFFVLFFYFNMGLQTCWQITIYFCHVLINMKILWIMKAIISWLQTKFAWVLSATLTGKKNRFWDTALCRYMTPQSWQTKWFPRKSCNRPI